MFSKGQTYRICLYYKYRKHGAFDNEIKMSICVTSLQLYKMIAESTHTHTCMGGLT